MISDGFEENIVVDFTKDDDEPSSSNDIQQQPNNDNLTLKDKEECTWNINRQQEGKILIKQQHVFEVEEEGAYKDNSDWKDFSLDDELLNNILDYGYEYPTPVQQKCLQQAISAKDLICQAKSGAGKTAIFVITTLQQIQPVYGKISVIVLCPTYELAIQTKNVYMGLAKQFRGLYIDDVVNFTSRRNQKRYPHILTGTPTCVLKLINDSSRRVPLFFVDHFIIDECDLLLGDRITHGVVKQVMSRIPYRMQIMLFCSTLPHNLRRTCESLVFRPHKVYVNNEASLLPDNIQHFTIKTQYPNNDEKTSVLMNLLGTLGSKNQQVYIFTRSSNQARYICESLIQCNFPNTIYSTFFCNYIHRRTMFYEKFNIQQVPIMVTIDGVFSRGIAIGRATIVINYEMPMDSTTLFQRIGRVGRSGRKGLVISFVASGAEDELVLQDFQDRFQADVTPFPEDFNINTYMSNN